VSSTSGVEFLGPVAVGRVVPVFRETQAMHNRAVSKLGSAYDVPALLWFLFYLLATRKGWAVPRLSINPKWMLCSEYVHYIVTGETETVTPGDLYDGGVW
jgi:hypothetical protein